MSNLIVEPITRLNFIKSVGNSMGANFTKDYSVHFSNIFVVLVWTAVFVFMSYKLLEKRDL